MPRSWGHHGPAIMRRLADANGRIVTQERLIQAMYPGGWTAPTADDVLKQEIYRLRKRLPAGAITTHPGEGYRLDPAAAKAWLSMREAE